MLFKKNKKTMLFLFLILFFNLAHSTSVGLRLLQKGGCSNKGENEQISTENSPYESNESNNQNNEDISENGTMVHYPNMMSFHNKYNRPILQYWSNHNTPFKELQNIFEKYYLTPPQQTRSSSDADDDAESTPKASTHADLSPAEHSCSEYETSNNSTITSSLLDLPELSAENIKKHMGKSANEGLLSLFADDLALVEKIMNASGNTSITVSNTMSPALYSSKPDDNSVYSLPCFTLPLAFLAAGSDGDTKNECIKLFGQSNIDDVLVQESIKNRLLSDTGSLKSTLSIYFESTTTSQIEFLQPYDKKRRKCFSLLGENAFFKPHEDMHSEAFVKEVNDFVSDKTSGKISSILDEPLKKDTKMVILSTIYFKEEWLHGPFYTKDNFSFYNYGKGEPEYCPGLTCKTAYSYKDNDWCYSLISFKSRQFQALFVMPNKNYKEAFSSGNANIYEKAINTFYTKRDEWVISKVHFPELKIESDWNLAPIMSTNHILDSLLSESPNFKNLFKEKPGQKHPVLGEIRQKAMIELDCNGVTAAAVQSLIFTFGSLPANTPPKITYNKPFKLFIICSTSKNVLFEATIVKRPERPNMTW